jgi:multidrug efflux pump subunit AcrA (membrane-fusion protein)
MNARRPRRYITVLCAALIFSLLLSACNGPDVKDTAHEAEALPVASAGLERGEIVQTAEFTGKLSFEDSVNVASMLSGKVTAVNFNVGDEVKEGAVLFETARESAVRAREQAKNGYVLVRIAGEQAKLGLEQAKVNYELSIQNIDSAVSGSASALSDLNYEKQLTMALQAYNSAESQLNIISGDRIDTSHFNEIRRELREAEKALAANEEGSWERYRDAWDDYNYFADDYADYQGYLTALDNAYENLELVRESYEIYKGIQNDEKLSTSELQRKLAELSYQSAQKSAGISDINLSNALKTV